MASGSPPEAPHRDARWDEAAARALERPYLDPHAAAVKRRAQLELLDRWLPDLRGRTVLKTDLWEEGVAGDELLLTLASRAEAAYGLDVSPLVVASARRAAADAAAEPTLLCADVRDIPLPTGSVDIVVSTSTIDHFQAEEERAAAVAELRRVLAPAGTLVLTVDNSDNVGDPLLRLAAAVGAVPFPLGPALSRDGLRDVVSRAGLRVVDDDYVVFAPRVAATAAVRVLRRLPADHERTLNALQRGFDALGRRWPRRLGCFVAVRAVQPRSAARTRA